MPTESPGLRALIVEDFRSMGQMMERILDSLNITCFQARNGIEALDILEREEVDIVLSDLVMPEMDGYELCEEIRRRPNLRHIPFVVTSTHRDAQYVIRALRVGADDYVCKPFTAQLVQRVVERATSNV